MGADLRVLLEAWAQELRADKGQESKQDKLMRPVTKRHTELVIMIVLDSHVLLSPNKIRQIHAQITRQVIKSKEHDPGVEHPRCLASAVKKHYECGKQHVGPDVSTADEKESCAAFNHSPECPLSLAFLGSTASKYRSCFDAEGKRIQQETLISSPVSKDAQVVAFFFNHARYEVEEIGRQLISVLQQQG